MGPQGTGRRAPMTGLPIDQLMKELVSRASEVVDLQDRLQGLLHASRLITSELSLDGVLERIVDVARNTVDAQYAALGVIGADGTLDRFIHTGMDPRHGPGDRSSSRGPRTSWRLDHRSSPDPADQYRRRPAIDRLSGQPSADEQFPRCADRRSRRESSAISTCLTGWAASSPPRTRRWCGPWRRRRVSRSRTLDSTRSLGDARRG